MHLMFARKGAKLGARWRLVLESLFNAESKYMGVLVALSLKLQCST